MRYPTSDGIRHIAQLHRLCLASAKSRVSPPGILPAILSLLRTPGTAFVRHPALTGPHACTTIHTPLHNSCVLHSRASSTLPARLPRTLTTAGRQTACLRLSFGSHALRSDASTTEARRRHTGLAHTERHHTRRSIIGRSTSLPGRRSRAPATAPAPSQALSVSSVSPPSRRA